MQHPDNADLCACGQSADDVSMAHSMSCGEDALATRDEAVMVVDKAEAAIRRVPLHGSHLLTTSHICDPHATGLVFEDDD